MDKQTATQLIGNTFNFPFDEGRFRNFAINLLNDVDEAKRFDYISGTYIRHSFKNHISKYKRLGTYTDPNGDKIDVLVVQLKNEWALERSRTMLRNFTSDYLKNRDEKDAALVAYYTTNPDDWRFSYIRMEYKREKTESGKFKITQDITPAKRYSFLVGKNEPNHTAQAQLVSILENDRKNPTLNDIESAFSVDAVTKQFYKDYRSQFEKLWNELNDIIDKDPKIAAEFETKSIDTANFAKKLMGQIVFLYFLQKKGWLGVGKDDKGNFKKWGTGPKNFLHRLFKKEFTDYGNFFNEVLEPLFYEALATEHTDDYYSHLDCKIPFLNGGLFEPLNDYNWRETDIRIDNDLIGDVFKTFDQYNFTVREDEPLEKEVAVDPEMLGKVFENLLPENLRKGKGAYYTPRTIVHYMCQESLINYLLTEVTMEPDSYEEMGGKQLDALGNKPIKHQLMFQSEHGGKVLIPKEDIETLIREGDIILELETAIVEEGKKYKTALMDSIKENAQVLDDALANIKVCDPAIGSGAFPVGMLTEIVKARTVLSLYLDKELNKNRTIYNFKRHCIQNSLYGVDIDPGAIEIAKLRLWLSLVVDEDDYTSIQPLPNLDYKIMQGNSLIEEFHDISLDIEKKSEQKDLFAGGGDLDKLIDDLHQKQADFFNAEHPREKKKKRQEVETAIYNIFHSELAKKINISPLDAKVIESDLREMTHGNKERNFFPWKLYFADVFREKGGFDVVIANPPWDKVKPYDQEFFEKFDKKYREYSKADQKIIIEKLLIDSSIRKKYKEYKILIMNSIKYFREKYKLQGKGGDLNLYKLFLEKGLLISNNTLNYIIPGQLTIDKGNLSFRNKFIKERMLINVIGLTNKKGLFHDVDNNQKFVILSLTISTTTSKFNSYGWSDEFNESTINKFVKQDYTTFENFDTNRTYYLTKNISSYKIYNSFITNDSLTLLGDFGFHFWTEYHGTNDAKYFSDVKGKYKIFSGKAIGQYDYMSKYWLEKHGRSSRWKNVNFPKDSNAHRTEYFVDKVPERIWKNHKKNNSHYRLVVQDVTGTVNNKRTTYTTILPKTNLTNNTLNNLYIGESDKELVFYCCVLNSFIFDWIARMKVATHLNKFVLNSLIIPRFDKIKKDILNQILFKGISLIAVNSEFDELTRIITNQSSYKSVLVDNEFDRQKLKNEIDVLIGYCYNISEKDFDKILNEFPQVDDRIKSDILSQYLTRKNE